MTRPVIERLDENVVSRFSGARVVVFDRVHSGALAKHPPRELRSRSKSRKIAAGRLRPRELFLCLVRLPSQIIERRELGEDRGQ